MGEVPKLDCFVISNSNSNSNEETRSNLSSSSERIITAAPAPPRAKKQISFPPNAQSIQLTNRAPMPPPRRTNSTQK